MINDKIKFPQIVDSVEFSNELMNHANWFSGVPDSVFKKTISRLNPFYLASRENHAIGMAFGAALAGKRPAVLIQNSGLGLMIDALFGLQQLYEVGVLLIVSNRGELDWEETQHQRWGDVTKDLLKSIDVPVFDFSDGFSSLEKAAELGFKKQKISVLLIHRGNIDE